MPNLKDNWKQWRDAASIDWFSQFIKAWIPFNAWMTYTFGDLTDKDLLDNVKKPSNVIYNRIVPILTWTERQGSGRAGAWQDASQDAETFRLHIEQLHVCLQGCLVEGRRGRISFETVDVGYNSTADEQMRKLRRDFRVRRDHPAKGNVTLEMVATKTLKGFVLTQPTHDRRSLEDAPTFQLLRAEYRTILLGMHTNVAPRRVISVLAPPGSQTSITCGSTHFIQDPEKLFFALVDVAYSLRNALFHGSLTPNDQHNQIYEPAYHIVMRLVKCTI